jgi:RimJ/RimL family protein N-acetyltransferase
MDRIAEMKKQPQKPELVFARLGRVKLNTVSGAFDIQTKQGAILRLCPNSDDTVENGVHIDEIEVPEAMRGKGIATKALAVLCRLADEYRFELEGGPIGFSDDPFRERFIAWVRRFGFKRDARRKLSPSVDKSAFYVRRRPGVAERYHYILSN